MKRLSILATILGVALLLTGCPEKPEMPSGVPDPMPPADVPQDEPAGESEDGSPATAGGDTDEAPPVPSDEEPTQEEAPKLVAPEQANDSPPDAPADEPADKPAE